MKQIFYFFLSAMFLFSMSNKASAQYDPRYDDYPQRNADCRNNNQQSFYFYPQSNVYYSFATGQYIYPYRGSWVVSDQLPHHWRLHNEPRFVVMHYGFDVWNENRFHIAKFRGYRYGQPDMAYAPPQGRFYDEGRGSRWYNEDNRQDNGWRH